MSQFLSIVPIDKDVYRISVKEYRMVPTDPDPTKFARKIETIDVNIDPKDWAFLNGHSQLYNWLSTL